jgi:hypothetical protein
MTPSMRHGPARIPRVGFGARPPGNSAAMTQRVRDELFVIWSAARAEANIAYDAWCSEPGPDAYAVYRAAEDRADAAELALSGVAPEPVLALA